MKRIANIFFGIAIFILLQVFLKVYSIYPSQILPEQVEIVCGLDFPWQIWIENPTDDCAGSILNQQTGSNINYKQPDFTPPARLSPLYLDRPPPPDQFVGRIG